MSKKEKGITTNEQMSIFDILNLPFDIDKKFSTQEIDSLISQLTDAKRKAMQREKEEKKKIVFKIFSYSFIKKS